MRVSLFALLAILATAGVVSCDKVESGLLEKLSQERGTVIISFSNPWPKVNKRFHRALKRKEREMRLMDPKQVRTMKRELLYRELNHFADLQQSEAMNMLSLRGLKFHRLWISDSLVVRDVSDEDVNALSKLDRIKRIEMDKIVARIDMPIEVEESFSVKDEVESTSDEIVIPWSLKQISVDKAWSLTRGAGVVVANIDTGVLYSHEALVHSYRGNLGNGEFSHDFNWFDPRDASVRTPHPSDNNGHGTHTMGSIVGHTTKRAMGVAPDAKWIAAKGCASGSCYQSDLLASGQWVICPTDLSGEVTDCSKGADVVSNSWGGGRGNDWYFAVIEAWRAAGMVPVFAQGNSGSSCGSANSPGDNFGTIGVGATNEQFQLAYFSSRGPGVNSETFPSLKPDISAPGQAIYSAYNTNNESYSSLSGTSMATPHVAGVVALILSRTPQASIDEIFFYLISSTQTRNLIKPTGAATCGGIAWNVFPNNHYGYGLIDALPAIQKAEQEQERKKRKSLPFDMSPIQDFLAALFL